MRSPKENFTVVGCFHRPKSTEEKMSIHIIHAESIHGAPKTCQTSSNSLHTLCCLALQSLANMCIGGHGNHIFAHRAMESRGRNTVGFSSQNKQINLIIVSKKQPEGVVELRSLSTMQGVHLTSAACQC